MEMNTGFNNKLVSNVSNITFLGILIDKSLFWKSHTDLLIPKLSAACYAIRTVHSFIQNTLYSFQY